MTRLVSVVAGILLVSACNDSSLPALGDPTELDAGDAPRSTSRDAGEAPPSQHDDPVTPQAGAPAPPLHDSDPHEAQPAKPNDAGVVDANAGDPKHVLDAGNDTQPIVDGGNHTTPVIDAGGGPTPIVDASTEPVRDAGQDPAPVDAGTDTPPVIDAGNDTSPVIDAGNDTSPVIDAGNETPPVIDAGNETPPVIDAGTQDAATPALDAGPDPVLDAGTQDAAPPALDAGSDPVLDAGTQDAAPPAVDAGAPDAAAPSCSGPPGMYQDDKCQVLADGLQAYHPQYPLWSDGANKERYIYLPPGTQIDTSNPDRWSFPLGTRLYKTFAAGTTKVETRVLEKTKSTTDFTSWTTVSYAWSADQRSVSPASTSGVTNALGTGLDIPSTAQCKSCHSMVGADAPIGFNALQLNHDAGGVTLADLIAANLIHNFDNGVPNVSVTNAVIPGDDATRAALGYLHGNCGHCHGGPSPRAGQRLWSIVGMTQLSDAPIMQSAVCQCLEGWTGRSNADGDAYTLRVAPSHAAISGIIGRMSSRVSGEQMPPLGTKVVDATGLATIKAWITELDGASCDAAPPVCSP